MPRRCLWFAFLACFMLCGTEHPRAQEKSPVILPGEGAAAAGRIDEIRQQLTAKKWEAALAGVQALIETGGDELAPLGTNRAVNARLACYQLLLGLPADVRPEVLRLYRVRAEASARKWLEQGLAARDARLLRKVVEEAFLTRSAEKALDALGDLAFERGDFAEAEQWWRTLTPLQTPAPDRDLFFPDPEIDAGRTRAKQLLSRLFRGDLGWDDALRAYRKLHADTAGKLAGRDGRYADTLQAVATDLRRSRTAGEHDWPTFGGSAMRGGVVPMTAEQTDRLGALCRRLTWQFDLEKRERDDDPPPPANWDGNDRQTARRLAFHPIIVGERIIVADGRHVSAYNLRTGRSEPWFDAAQISRDFQPEDVVFPPILDRRFTLSLGSGCILCRFEEATTAKRHRTYLVCLDLEANPSGRRLRWMTEAGTDGKTQFEGTPLIHLGQAFVAMTRTDDERTTTSIRCYPLEAKGTPPVLWTRDVCETPKRQAHGPEGRPHLLTLAGPNVVYCSHTGAITALDTLTGRHAWSVRYPTVEPAAPPELPGIDRARIRDLTPCLFVDGRVFAAPADSDRLLCLDAVTGRMLWQRPRMAVMHLLGTASGRLIFATATGLQAVAEKDGSDIWIAPDAGELPPMGRGLLLGDLVLWPTTRGVLLVRQDTGRLAEDPAFLQAVPKGNLAFGNGCLVVTGRGTMTVFVPPARQREQLRHDVEAEPESAATALELGLAEMDAGQVDTALKTLARAERLTKGKQPRIVAEASTARHRTLLLAGRLEEAAAAEFPAAARVAAIRRHAEELEKSNPAGAVALWQTLLEDPGLHGVRVQSNELLATAGQLAEDRIALLIKTHGTKVYEGAEKRARALRENAKGAERIALLEQLTEQYPNAACRREVLRELANLYREQRRFLCCFHACRRLGDYAVSIAEVNQLCHEQTAALSSWTKANSPEPKLVLPLMRSWEVKLDGDECLLRHAGSWVFTKRSGSPGSLLRCRSADTGKALWDTPLPLEPEWLLGDAHVAVVGNGHQIAGVRSEDGHLLWTFPASLSYFRYDGWSFLFLEAGYLRALDTCTGKVSWQRALPGGAFLVDQRPPAVICAFFHLFVHTGKGRLWELDPATGRTIHDLAAPSEPWRMEPTWITVDRAVLVPDCQHVVLFDAAKGENAWQYTVNAPAAIASSPPRVKRCGRSLLVATETSLGWRLQKLNLATGKALWSTMPLLDAEPLNWSDGDFDSECVYLARGRSLLALSLADGSRRWQVPLIGPTAMWKVCRWNKVLLAYPAGVAQWQLQFRSPFGALQWKVSFPPEEGQGCPLLALDPATGKLVQRWNFPAAPARFRVQTERCTSWFGWTISHESGPVDMQVFSSNSGLVVNVGGKMWGLAPR